MTLPFDSHGSTDWGPLVLSVPHAGRHYPTDLADRLAVPVAASRLLEDRHADQLADAAIAAGVRTLVARTPRLLIDLNRAETDFDPTIVAGRAPGGMPLSEKARSGLGLVPHRLAGLGHLWRAPLAPHDLAQRIAGTHRPYHAALATALAAAQRRFGVALLIDLHSMPPLAGTQAADIVLGDRHGTTAGAGLVDAAAHWLRARHFRVARNAPYAGGHLIERHGGPAQGRHALQIEIDRRLYLDAALDAPGPGLIRMSATIAALLRHLADLALRQALPVAAE